MRGLVWLGLLAFAASGLRAQDSLPTGRARISYVAAGTAYLDAGREDGLREGQRLQFLRNGRAVGDLIVAALASHRAACTIAPGGPEPVVGDTVVFTPAAPAVVRDASAPAVSRAPTRSRDGAVHGRIGLRYLAVQPVEAPGFTQPALDLRVDGTRLGGSAFGLVVDVRARRTYRTASDGTSRVDARDVVYQSALLVRTRGAARMTLGRQYLPTVSSVSLFDGALIELQGARFGAGVFAGAEPDPATMGWSSDLRDVGVFLEGRSAPGAALRYTLAGGALGSYARGGVVNREFGFLQASLGTGAFALFVAQELDLNRAWKADAGEPALALTSTFASLILRPTPDVSLSAGFDNRRNVRLYRDYVNPESLFDDSFRRGVWAGVGATLWGHLRLGLDGRTAFGEDSLSRTRSGTASLALDRLSSARGSVRSRHTLYASAGRHGVLHSVALGLRPWPGLGLEASAGQRREHQEGARRLTRWGGGDLDLALGRSVYLLMSFVRERGEQAAGDQWYAGLSWRF